MSPNFEDAQISMVRTRWDEHAVRFTETANKRLTWQCASQLHTHLQLDTAQHVLEVAAGAGLGSLDIIRHLKHSQSSTEKKKTFIVTDLSTVMVDLARQNLRETGSELLDIQVMDANGQDLRQIPTGSQDRYIANLCLQLTPDPDAMLRETRRVLCDDGIAGFTIWGKPEHSALFTIDAQVTKELGFGKGEEHANFALGKDLVALRERFVKAGFSQVRIWPFLCVLELWSGEDFASFLEDRFYTEGEERSERFRLAQRLADEWLAKGYPLGLETYIIVAKP